MNPPNAQIKPNTLNFGLLSMVLAAFMLAGVHPARAQQIVTNIAAPGGLDLCAVNPALNKLYFASGNPAAEQIVVVDGVTFSQTGVGNGQGVDVDVTNNNYWSAGVYSDSVTAWSSSNVALASPATGSGCAVGVSVDAPHRRVWAGAQCSDSIWVFNADTYAYVAGPISPGGVMGAILVNPATDRAYFTSSAGSQRVNPSTFAVTANAFGAVIGVNAAANLLYAQNGTTLQIVNGTPDPEVVLTNIPLPNTFGSRIGVNPVLNRIYIGYNNTNLVAVLNATNGQTIANLSLGAGITSVGSIVVDPSRNLVYALASGRLVVIQDNPAPVLQTNIYLFTGSETNITLPPGTYMITAYGAQGGTGNDGSGGLGAEMSGKFNFTAPTTFTLLVGGGGGSGPGGTYSGNMGGGGGGSFIIEGSTPLVIAGGGGGATVYGLGNPGLITTNGGSASFSVYSASGTGGTGGTGGGSGYRGGGGGGGFLGNGVSGNTYLGPVGGGFAFINGGAGGSDPDYGGGTGGFGGGGGGNGWSGGTGGGGGYSGGGAGLENDEGGGGGGSIIDSSAITNLAEVSGIASPDDSPNGEIIITTVSTTVSPPTLTNIVISPASPIIAATSNQTFLATGYFSDGSSSSLAAANGLVWSSSSPGVATINTNGVATGVSLGTTQIIAASGGVSASNVLTVVVVPSIATNPVSATASSGGTVTLTVSANGGDLSYQWQFDGTNLAGATGASLVITNVSAASFGVYSVMVSNAAGSVTSTSVTLASVDIHLLASVYLNGPVGSNYLIQAASNLSGSWTTLTNVTLPTQPYIYVDYGSVTNQQQFYRAVPQ